MEKTATKKTADNTGANLLKGPFATIFADESHFEWQLTSRIG